MAAARSLWRRIVEGRWADNLANNLGVPGGRRQQEAMDLERLSLYTQLWTLTSRSQAAPSQQDYQQLVMQVNAMATGDHRQQVAACMQHQITAVATILHEQILQAGDAAHAGWAMEGACLRLLNEAPAAQQGRHAPTPAPLPSQRHLSPAEVSQLLQQRLGYSLELKPSSIQHPSAGLGVFLRGQARVGSLVALVPGLVYNRTQLARMPNYPKVSLGNDYLSSRYDMTIIDSLSWKRAVESQHCVGEQAQGTPSQQSTIAGNGSSSGGSSTSDNSRNSSGAGSSSTDSVPSYGSSGSSSNSLHHASDGGGHAQSDVGATGPDAYARWALSALELRHPLALGHMINHPAPGMQPNVLEVAWDMTLDIAHLPPWLRAYLPMAPGLDLDLECGDAAQALLLPPGAQEPSTKAALVIRGLALVATRNIKDGEELLQNYRLSPYSPRPDWYQTIDAEEEHRRWAPLAFKNMLTF